MTAEHPAPQVPLGPRPPLRRRAWFRARALLRSERAWRLAGTLILATTATWSAFTGWEAQHAARDAQAAAERIEASESQTADAACTERRQSRRDVRDAISVATEILADYAELRPSDRDEITRLIREGVLDAFPAPDC